jgi:hypothetical protein
MGEIQYVHSWRMGVITPGAALAGFVAGGVSERDGAFADTCSGALNMRLNMRLKSRGIKCVPESGLSGTSARLIILTPSMFSQEGNQRPPAERTAAG